MHREKDTARVRDRVEREREHHAKRNTHRRNNGYFYSCHFIHCSTPFILQTVSSMTDSLILPKSMHNHNKSNQRYPVQLKFGVFHKYASIVTVPQNTHKPCGGMRFSADIGTIKLKNFGCEVAL